MPATLQGVRKRITEWEASFREANGRKPLPPEIKANPEIHKLYIEYRELKGSRLQHPAGESKSTSEVALESSADEKQHQNENRASKKMPALSTKTVSVISREHIELWKQRREKARLMATATSRTSFPCLPSRRSDVPSMVHVTKEIESQDSHNETEKCQQRGSHLACGLLCDANHTVKSSDINGHGQSITSDQSPATLISNGAQMKGPICRDLSKVVSAPKRGLIFREQSRSSEPVDVPLNSKDSIDLYCHEVLTPFDTSAMLVTPGISMPDINLADREKDMDPVKKHLFSDINDIVNSGMHNDQTTPMIKRQECADVVPESQMMLKLSASYSKPKIHPLQKKEQGKLEGGVPVRNNFAGGRKRFKGRGSKAGGVKPMGWKKSVKYGKGRGSKSGTCFTCGKTGHWSKDCPALEGSTGKNCAKSIDGEDMLDLVADELILADSSNMEKADKENFSSRSRDDASSVAGSSVDHDQIEISGLDGSGSILLAKKEALKEATCQDARTRSARKRKSVGGNSPVELSSVKRHSTRGRASETSARAKDAKERFDPENTHSLSEEIVHNDLGSISIPGVAPVMTESSAAVCVDGDRIFCTDTSENMKETLQVLFGHENFRSGQEEALQRVLGGRSTLFISATGGGKSLCYQLPAYKLKGTTLVVSPLLSLIQDQLEHLPSSIRGATLNSQQTKDEYHDVVERLRAGEVDVLFVAPERLFTDAFISVARSIPPFPLVCIDEVHCISEWAHNFRPSYLRLKSLLRDVLNVRCILGLTATATRSMEREITDALGIDSDGIVRSDILRRNLRLTVSKDKNRQLSLLDMLQKDARFKSGSIIVYCALRAQCEDVAKYLTGQSVSATYYHAGRTARDRQSIQKRFFSGKLRVVVATVAFGMGLDKSDVRGIIHYSCPQSIESYVQEIGRAGRDGKTAYCHLFLHEDDETRMKSFAHGEGIEKVNIFRVVNHVLIGSPDHSNPAEVRKQRNIGEHVQIDEEDDVSYDVARESIETILCFLEQKGLVEVCNSTAAFGTLSILTSQRRELEQSSQVVAAIVRFTTPRNGQWKFTPASIANHLSCNIWQVTRELRSLKSQRLIRVEWSGRAFLCRVLSKPSSISDTMAEAVQAIHDKFVALEQRKVNRLQTLHSMLHRVAEACWADAAEEKMAESPASCESMSERPADGQGQLGLLAQMIGDYFLQDRQPESLIEKIGSEGGVGKDQELKMLSLVPDQEVSLQKDRFLRADIINLLHNIQKDNPLLTGRSVARILHGLQSPAFPAKIWYRHSLWGRYATTDFDVIRTMANAAIAAQS